MYSFLIKMLSYVVVRSSMLSEMFRYIKLPGLWDEVSARCDIITAPYVYEYRDCLNWTTLCSRIVMNADFILKVLSYVDFKAISKYQTLTQNDLIKFYYLLNWDLVSQYQTLDVNTLRICKEKINWLIASKYQTLPEDIIEEHSEKVSWENISQYQKMFSVYFITKFGHRLNWYILSRTQKLPYSIIAERRAQVDKVAIAVRGDITPEQFLEIFGSTRDAALLIEACTIASSIGVYPEKA